MGGRHTSTTGRRLHEAARATGRNRRDAGARVVRWHGWCQHHVSQRDAASGETGSVRSAGGSSGFGRPCHSHV